MRQILLCLALLALFTAASAQGAANSPDAKAMALVERGPLHLGSINSGFKASEDYLDANINLVAPVWSSMGSDGLLGGGVVFLEPYVSWGEGGEVATSLGLGYRYLFNDQPVSALRKPTDRQAGFFDEGVSIGASLFLDMLDTEADNQFWQLGFGVELASRYLELRGNYYLPLTDRQLAERREFTETKTSSRTTTKPVTETSASYDNGQGFLVQDQTTSLYATTTVTTTSIRHIFERYEEGMEGWDAEIALLVPGLDKWCDVKLIGGYFSLDNAPFGPQTGGTGNVEGWKAGVEIRPVPALAVTGMWYEDERFIGSDWMVGVRMEIPFESGDLGDGKGMWGRIRDAFTPRRRHLAERMAEPVHRQNAAIHLSSSSKQNSKVSKQTTTSSVQVISQTKKKIVLGLGPSATNFTPVANGSLILFNGSSTSSYGGTMYVNQIGHAVFVPDNGGAALLLPASVMNSGIGAAVRFNATSAVNSSSFSISNGAASSSTLIMGSNATGATLDLNGSTTNTLTNNVGAVISDVSLGSITKTGTGRLTLTGSNTYAGATNITGGTLGVTGQSITGMGVPSGATLATIVNSSAFTLSQNGAVTQVMNGTNTVITGGLIKNGAGTINLAGSNTYTGSTTINQGNVNFANGTILTGALTVSSSFNGTIQLPTSVSATSLTLLRSVTIGGATVPTGTYPITGGSIDVGGTIIPLSGATITP